MADKLNAKKVALSLAIVSGLLHAIGVLLLQAGLVNYWQWAHFVNVQYSVGQFAIGTFIVGIVTAFVIGYIVGLIYASVYNWVK
jgi:hypothetical protein